MRANPVSIATVLWLCVAAQAAAGTEAENSGGFRGPRRNGIFPATGLLKKWPEGGPKLLWEARVGGGWTAASVADGRVFFCGRDGNSPDVAMVALDLDGKQLWRTVYGPDKSPRATPTVADGRVYYESLTAVVYALDARTGQVLWSFDAGALGDTLPKCGGNSGSPLVHGDVVIFTTRSPGSEVPGGNEVPPFVALDRKTGKLAWKGQLGPCPVKGKGWSSFHSSAIPMQAGNTPIIVSQFFRAAGAVRADTGEKCWLEMNDGKKGSRRGQVQAVANEGYLFVFGTKMLKVAPDGSLKDLWEGNIRISEYNISYSHSLIKDGRLIAFLPAGSMNPTQPGRLVMLDAETGKEIASLPCAAKGSFIWADGLIYLLDNRPAVVLIEATRDALREVASFKPPLGRYATGSGVQLFTQPIVAEGRLFLRDQAKVLVYDLRASRAQEGGKEVTR